MTAASVPQDRFQAPPSVWSQLFKGPRQGWLSVGLLAVMLVTTGFAVDDARWVGNAPLGGSQTAFLPYLMLLGGLIGLLLGRSHVRTARSHLLASVLGAIVLLIVCANSVSAAPSLLERLRDLSDSFGSFVTDVVVLGARSTETSAFVLALGAICFTSAYFSTYNVFRRSRGMPAVISIGLLLLINMAITIRLQYPYLIVLALSGMLLLIRLNLVQQELGWRRRHIAGLEASRLLLRGGAFFVGITMVGAVALAATASSAPLQSFWRDLDDPLANLAVSVNRLVGGVTGTTRQAGGLFGSAETIQGVWEASDAPVFRVATNDGNAYYWRGANYDSFDGLTWTQTNRVSQEVVPNGELLFGTPELITGTSPARRLVTATVTSVSLAGGTLLAPETPVQVDRASVIRTVGPTGALISIGFANAVDPGQSYTVTSAVPITDNITTGITGNLLAAAGTNYPDWVKPYTVVAPNAVGQIAYDTANRIVGNLKATQRDPYDIAVAMQAFFNNTDVFHYSTDVRGICGRESVVDCLLTHKVGYCQHYATAMAMLLRTQGIPARFVEGYLPGKLATDGSREVDASAAHAWVEVFFPGYGWLRFDPTPGNDGNGRAQTDLPAGGPVSRPSPTPDASHAPATPGQAGDEVPNDPLHHPLGPPVAPDTGVSGPAAVTGLLVLVVGLALFARRRRRGMLGADQTYERIRRLAARLGYAANPSQTAYEYAGSLGDVLPGIRQDLYVVAHAKVESTYARKVHTSKTVANLNTAYGRVRRGLLRLVLRRRPSAGGGRS